MLPEDLDAHWHDGEEDPAMNPRLLGLCILAALIGLAILLVGVVWLVGSYAPQIEQHGEAR